MRVFTITNEWQRFEVTGTTTDVYAVDFRNASTTLSEVLVWGAQGENLSYATSYIPTNGELTELHVTKTYATMAVV